MLDDIRLRSTDSQDVDALCDRRDVLVKQALAGNDIALLQAIRSMDMENLATLCAEKKKLETELVQLNKLHQYVSL